jgi:hypothetical protein
LVYADVSLLGDSVNTIKKNTETLLDASRDIGLEINAEKTKYMIMSRHPNSGQNQNIRIANESFERWQSSNTWGLKHRLRVFENRVLRIFGSKREEDGSWVKLHNDEFYNLYSSPNIVRVNKSRRLSWA